ncbi:MAG: anthranilate phosphoribosyltransferase, partial [Proteobacteria bacterium]|nr:anthranilate phosphoribosyltransferase [Pseudomonadota bacterium]
MAEFQSFIAKVAEGQALSADEAAQAFSIMMSGDATPAQMGAFLMGLRVRGESVEEITGAAQAMRARAARVKAPEGAIDTCGTGGDAKGTYNISTCAAFVVAGAGVPVAKHGNKAVSSKSGSADVLAALGVNLDVGPELVTKAIAEAGVGFMFAPKHHAAMRFVAPVRAELGMRTIFNLLGPLANPAGTKHQLIGVFSRDWIVPLAEVLANLGSNRVWVVHGSDGLDELTTTGPTYVAELKNGSVTTFEVTPEDAGLAQASAEDLAGGDANENAKAITDVLSGQSSAFRDIV